MNFLHSGNLLPRRDIHPAPMQGRHGTCKVHPGKAEWDKLCLSSAAANHSPNPVWKLEVSAPTARDTNRNPQSLLLHYSRPLRDGLQSRAPGGHDLPDKGYPCLPHGASGGLGPQPTTGRDD